MIADAHLGMQGDEQSKMYQHLKQQHRTDSDRVRTMRALGTTPIAHHQQQLHQQVAASASSASKELGQSDLSCKPVGLEGRDDTTEIIAPLALFTDCG